MRLEGDDAQRRVGGRVAGDVDDRPVADMDPVEIADGDGGTTVAWAYKLIVTDDAHEVWVNRSIRLRKRPLVELSGRCQHRGP